MYNKQDYLWKGYWDVFALPNFIFTLKHKWHSKFAFLIALLFLFALLDQYAFCRYVIDMFAQGDFYPGTFLYRWILF